jgi:cephalosporin hydroxylase
MEKKRTQISRLSFLLLAAVAVAVAGCSPEEVEHETYPGASEVGRTKPFSAYAEIDKRTFELREKQPIYFLGVPMQQIPTDNWLIGELIYKIKPDYIIETGTLYGGSALYYAAVLELVNPEGIVITVDIDDEQIHAEAKGHELYQRRVKFIHGGSTDDDVIRRIKEIVGSGEKTVLVTLDTLHAPKHVRKELELYSPFVSRDSYIIVQDTFYEELHGSIDDFLNAHTDFEVDHELDGRFGLTKFRGGFLKRI